ncbi:IncF transfer protein TrbB [Escherichia coli]|uniref:IncF transfer protein TrbB n=1 Tax=Escherichia coli TaxID=562 RepID=A0A376YKX8_ECOLX|nr:IncF transfer protein TrbB [Escherichia coli]
MPPDVMQTFFPNIPVATPTTFLVNVNTLEALPLLQGQRMPPVYGADGYRSADVRRKKRCEISRWCTHAGISGIATGIIVSLNIPFIHQGLFYPASPVEIVVSLCLTFSVSVVFLWGQLWDGFRCLKYITAAGLDGKYQDIPVETPYAPGEHIKGGQQ